METPDRERGRVKSVTCRLMHVIAIVLGLCQLADAGISSAPSSYVIPMRDNKHVFVMLSDTPLPNDAVTECELPDGQIVRLRQHFSSSGLYQIGSRIPVWAVEWYAEERLLFFSDDGRYVVRVNRFGAGGPGEDLALTWGVKFYASGEETATHFVKDLVEYPSLIPLTTFDWHRLWIHDSVYDSGVNDGTFDLLTSTHEWYQFDVATGRIVARRSLWKPIALGCVLFGALGVVVFFRVVIRRAWPSGGRYRVSCDNARACGMAATFSVRFLLIVLTVVCAIVALFRVAPPAAVFTASIVLAGFSSQLLRKVRHNVASTSSRIRVCFLTGIWTWTVMSWLTAYSLSAGPFLRVARLLNCPDDCREFVASTVYAPLTWLEQNTSVFEWSLVEWYFDEWE